MKKFSSLLVFPLTIFISFAQNISLNNKGLFINDVSISESWQLSVCKSVLGEPERTHKKAYIYSYDNKGIEVFEGSVKKKATGKLSEIQFHFSVSDTSAYAPKGLFSGKFTINEVTVSKATSYNELLPLLKDWEKTKTYSLHNFKYVSSFIYIYFRFNDAETELKKISIGIINKLPHALASPRVCAILRHPADLIFIKRVDSQRLHDSSSRHAGPESSESR